MEMNKNVVIKALCVLKLRMLSSISALIKTWGTIAKTAELQESVFSRMQAMVSEQNIKILTVFPLSMNSSHYNF